MRQEKVKRERNTGKMSSLRTHLKRVLEAIEKGDKEKANTEFNLTQALLDRYACKKLIHKNKAARHKSRLTAKIKNMPDKQAA